MIKKTAFFLLKLVLALIIISVSLLWYSGFFNPVYVTEKESGSFQAITGNCGYYDEPVEIRNVLFRKLNQLDISSKKALAVTSNPFEENLITKTGWVLKSNQITEAAELEPPYQILTIPRKKRLVADFAYDNDFSIMAGSVKVYNQLEKYCREKGYKTGAMYEIYDDEQQRIFYHLDIESD